MSSAMTASATASASSAATTSPYNYRIVGVILAIGSGLLIGSSFVFKKKGLLASQKGGAAGKGVAYLKNPLWWTGMTMMILGELCNFGAYAFVEALIVTPLGALSVVISAMLSSIFLNERLNFFGWIGCFQCIVGSVIIALNGPEEQSASTIEEFKQFFLAPGFLAFGSVVIVAALVIIFFVAPRYGEKQMIWYILVCSLIGGLSVSCTQGLGASIVTSVRGYNQFKNWFIYFLLGFVAVTLITEIYFLNVALALFNTAMVTPTYYVIFTFCTLVTSVILYQGLKASASQIITVVLGFLVICSGIILLQLSKIDPKKLEFRHNLDRKSALFIKVANEEVEKPDEKEDPGAAMAKEEEPGLDALRGFNGLVGTLARARRRTTIFHPEEAARSRSIYVPGLGRGPSIRVQNDEESTGENGATHPEGHQMAKSNTAPTIGAAPKTPTPVRSASATVPTRPITSFWHRRTGTGPRKTKVGHLPSGETLQLSPPKQRERKDSNAPPSSAGGHSFVGETVQEEEEPTNRPSEDTEISMRKLLAIEDERLRQKEEERIASGEGDDTIRAANGKISPPRSAGFPFSASPSDGATPYTDRDRAQSPQSMHELDGLPTSERRPLSEYFEPPQVPQLRTTAASDDHTLVNDHNPPEREHTSSIVLTPDDPIHMAAAQSIPSIILPGEEEEHGR